LSPLDLFIPARDLFIEATARLLKASVSWFTLAVVQVRVWSTRGEMVEQLKWLTRALIGSFSSPLAPRAVSCCWP
jgi:hypothetical protein